tara:strand:+ start:386 stop:1648 length:1263 start_codon:yes stop_codon:yes gene_type:complete
MTISKQEGLCHLCTDESEQPKKCSCCNFQTMSTAHTACCRACVMSNGKKHGPKCRKIIFQPVEPKRRNLTTSLFTNQDVFQKINFAITKGYLTNELYQILLNTLLFFIDYSEVNIAEHNDCWHRHLQDAISNFPSELIERIIISTIETYYTSKSYLNLMKDLFISRYYTLNTFKAHPQLFEFDTEEEAEEFSKRIEDKLGMITHVVRVPLKEQYHTLYEHVVVYGNGIDEEAREQMTCYTCGCSDCSNERWEIENEVFDYESLKDYDERANISIGHEEDGDKHFVLAFNEKNTMYEKCREIFFYEYWETDEDKNLISTQRERYDVQDNDFLQITVKPRIQTNNWYDNTILEEKIICESSTSLFTTELNERGMREKVIIQETLNYDGSDNDKKNDDNNYYDDFGNTIKNYINLMFHTPQNR